MEITEYAGRRFELLIEQLRAGATVTHGPLALSIRGSAPECRVGSLATPDTITERRARDALSRAANELAEARRAAPLLDEALGTGSVRFVLVHDYGMGGLEIAALQEDELHWLHESRRTT